MSGDLSQHQARRVELPETSESRIFSPGFWNMSDFHFSVLPISPKPRGGQLISEICFISASVGEEIHATVFPFRISSTAELIGCFHANSELKISIMLLKKTQTNALHFVQTSVQLKVPYFRPAKSGRVVIR